MKSAKKSLMLIFFAVVTMIAACGSPSDKYVGKWQNTKDASDALEIKKNGDGFIIEAHGNTIPATLQNGEVVMPFGSTTVKFVYIQDTNTLLMQSPMAAIDPSFGGTYKRL